VGVGLRLNDSGGNHHLERGDDQAKPVGASTSGLRGPPFAVADGGASRGCCYRRSCRPGLLLGEGALEELPERYCARGNFRPRAAPVLERLIQWPLQSDLDCSAGLYRRDIGVIGHVHLMRGTGARRDMPLRPARARRKYGK
jgi:hypothetical protein